MTWVIFSHLISRCGGLKGQDVDWDWHNMIITLVNTSVEASCREFSGHIQTWWLSMNVIFLWSISLPDAVYISFLHPQHVTRICRINAGKDCCPNCSEVRVHFIVLNLIARLFRYWPILYKIIHINLFLVSVHYEATFIRIMRESVT